MKTGISIKHGNGVSIYSAEKGLAEALSQGTPLPLTEEQQDAFGEFFELQTAKLREEADVETPIAPLPTDIIGMRGDLNRVVPAGFIMLYNKLDEIQKESSRSNGGGFLGFGGGGSSFGMTAAESEALQQVTAATVAASQSAQQSQVAAAEAQQAAIVAQQAAAQAASNAEATNPAISRIPIPLDPFRINLNTGLVGTTATKVQTQTAETLDPFKVSSSLAGDSVNSIKIARVAADIDQFRIDLSSLQATDQQHSSQISALGTFDTSIQSQVNDLNQSIQQNFGVVNSTLQGMDAIVSSFNAKIDSIDMDLNSQIYKLSVKVANLSKPASLPTVSKTKVTEAVAAPTANPDFAAPVIEAVQEVVAAITEGEAAQTVEAVQEALEEVGLDAETIAAVEEVVAGANLSTEEANELAKRQLESNRLLGTDLSLPPIQILNTEEANESIKKTLENNLKQRQLRSGTFGINLSGMPDRQNQTILSAPGSGLEPIFGLVHSINPTAAQANSNFAQTAGQQFVIVPSMMTNGDFSPAGYSPGVTVQVLNSGVGNVANL